MCVVPQPPFLSTTIPGIVGALPSTYGILPDSVVAEAFAAYLGLPSPAMRCFTHRPHFIGRSGRTQIVDPYGDSVARAMLNGGDFIRSHDELKFMLNGLFHKAGFATTVEAQNLFNTSVEWRYLEPYLAQFDRKDAIIPDILIHNYPADANANGHHVTPAIFDIKTVRVDKSGQTYRTGIPGHTILRAVEKRERSCKTDYRRRASALDTKFAPDDPQKPFTRTLQQNFHSGGVHPIIVGAFGETNIETHALLKMCAKHAAARESNSDVSPEEVASQFGSTYNILLAQFRRGLGCLSVRAAIEEKLRRVQLIRPTPTAAAAAADAGVGNHRNGHRRGPGWYHNQRNESMFDDFYRYSHQHDNFHFSSGATPVGATA